MAPLPQAKESLPQLAESSVSGGESKNNCLSPLSPHYPVQWLAHSRRSINNDEWRKQCLFQT